MLGEWILLPEGFAQATHVVGSPNEALHELHRHLLAGRIRSLRRRRLDGSVEDTELARTFWRDIEFFVHHKHGRELVGLHPVLRVDSSIRDPEQRRRYKEDMRASAEVAISGALFYLYGPDVRRIWAPIEPTTPAEPAARAKRKYAQPQSDRARSAAEAHFPKAQYPNGPPKGLTAKEFTPKVADWVEKNEARGSDRELVGGSAMPSPDVVERVLKELRSQ